VEKLSSVQIRRFKRIEDAPFDLDDLNVIVGANNAGKSSVIQGLHFAISLLQSVTLLQGWSEETVFGNEAVSTSINPNQLIYSAVEAPADRRPSKLDGVGLDLTKRFGSFGNIPAWAPRMACASGLRKRSGR